MKPKLSLEEIRFREEVTRARTWKISDNSASKWKSKVGQEVVIPSEETECTNGPDLAGRNKQCLSLTGGFPDSSVGKESAWMQETLVRFLGREDPLEKGQATHSSIPGLPFWLSWQRICVRRRRSGFDPWIGKIPWRRERLPTPVFWPGEFHRLYSPWGHKEADMTEQLSLWASLIVQQVKNPPAMQKTPVWFLGREDLLEKG